MMTSVDNNAYVKSFRAAATAAIRRFESPGASSGNASSASSTPKRRLQTYAGGGDKSKKIHTPTSKKKKGGGEEEDGGTQSVPEEYRTDLKVRMLQFVDCACDNAVKRMRSVEGGEAYAAEHDNMEPLDEALVAEVLELDRRAEEVAKRVREMRDRVPKLVERKILETIERERRSAERRFGGLTGGDQEEDGEAGRGAEPEMVELDRDALQTAARRVNELISNLSKRLPAAKDRFESALAAAEEARAHQDTTLERAVNANSLLVSESAILEVDPALRANQALAEGLEGRYAMY